MTTIVTLIANTEAVSDHAVDLRAELVPNLAAALQIQAKPRWLAENRAVDLVTESMDVAQAHHIAQTMLQQIYGIQAPIDLVTQPAEGRRKKLLLADMDSTIIEDESLDELAGHFGLKDKISAITARAMAGELDFCAALRERVGLLKGLSADAIEEVAAAMKITSGAATLVATMKAHGARCALVSGGFTFFTRRVADHLGFDAHFGNVLHIENGALTGTVGEPIRDAQSKYTTLTELCHANGVRFEDCITVGDGANDIPMLESAGTGVAFHAKPKVQAAARYAINHNDLTALLFIQGYAETDFTIGSKAP